MYAKEIKILETNDYPSGLKNIPSPPKILYGIGEVNVTKGRHLLGIVGTRKISAYGIAVLHKLFKELDKRIVIISGFMTGVDILAHTLALEYSMPTVSIVPSGFKARFMTARLGLANKIIVKGGALLTEFPDKLEPRRWTFAKRNRLIAGSSDMVLVVEATVGSGSLITADFAKKYRKPIAAVPGDIFRESEQGICQLLSNGAIPVSSGYDINQLLGFSRIPQLPYKTLSKALNSVPETLISCLSSGPIDINTLSLKTQINIDKLNSYLTKLQMENLISEDKGWFYVN